MMPQRNLETPANTMLEQPDFSLVQGGPLFQLFRRTHLSGDALELLRRWILIITAAAWLPLALLSLLDGRAFGEAVRIPFLYEVEAHVRFLVALPTLIIAELLVHHRIGPVLRRFVERRIVVTEDLPKLHGEQQADPVSLHNAVRHRFDLGLKNYGSLRSHI